MGNKLGGGNVGVINKGVKRGPGVVLLCLDDDLDLRLCDWPSAYHRGWKCPIRRLDAQATVNRLSQLD